MAAETDNAPPHTGGHDPREGHDPRDGQAHAAVPRFDPRGLGRDLAIDGWLRTGVSLLFLVVIVAVFVVLPEATWGSGLILLLVLLSWGSVNAVSAAAARDAGSVAEAIAMGEPDAADRLVALLRRRPLTRAIRLSLTQQWAVLALREDDPAEAIQVCRAVWRHRGREVWDADERATLLLHWADASMAVGLWHEAWWALCRVHEGRRPGLVESVVNAMTGRGSRGGVGTDAGLELSVEMRLLASQTRYEVECRHFDAALVNLRQKARLSELMPPPIAGHCHALWGRAATALGHPELADWCWQRAGLLLSNDDATTLRYTDLADRRDANPASATDPTAATPTPGPGRAGRLGERLDAVL